MMSSDWIPHPPTPLEEKYPNPSREIPFSIALPSLEEYSEVQKTPGNYRQKPSKPGKC